MAAEQYRAENGMQKKKKKKARALLAWSLVHTQQPGQRSSYTSTNPWLGMCVCVCVSISPTGPPTFEREISYVAFAWNFAEHCLQADTNIALGQRTSESRRNSGPIKELLKKKPH